MAASRFRPLRRDLLDRPYRNLFRQGNLPAAFTEEKAGVDMLALLYGKLGKRTVELLDGQLFFIEFFGCFLPEEDMVFNAVPAVEGVVGFGTVTAQGDVVSLAHKLFQRVSYFVGNEKNGVLSLMGVDEHNIL